MNPLGYRSDKLELMDTVSYPLPVMKKTLSFLEMTNRRFGGSNVILRHLSNWSKRWDPRQTIRILDVGAGAADIPLAVVRWARQHGFRVHVTAIDIIEEVVHIARENVGHSPDITIIQDDVFTYARRGEKFDYVIASLLLHHIPIAQTKEVIQIFDRIASRGVVLSDLERSLRSFGAVSLLSYLSGNFVVRHDGPLSVRRAFTLDELEFLAENAGLPYLKASPEKWFRLSLAGEKNVP